MRTRLLALAIVLPATLAACGSSSTLTARTLAKQAATIQSLAAEGGILADDAARGKATVAFTRIHATELRDAAATARTSLGKARPAPGVAARANEAQRLAGMVHTALAALAAAPGDRVAARALAQQLVRSAATAKALGGAS